MAQFKFELQKLPFLREHRVQQIVILPGSVYLEMAIAAAEAIGISAPFELRDIRFHEPCILAEGGDNSVHIELLGERIRSLPNRRC